MPRREPLDVAGVVFHVMNRGARRQVLFDESGDYRSFLDVMEEGRARTGIHLFAYCVMPNHFHLLVRPTADRQLGRFMNWFQLTHAKRWHQFRRSHGTGAVYQGRFRAVPVQTDRHFLVAASYVERNALRAGLVETAESWPWGSSHQRCVGADSPQLEPWPLPPPYDWTNALNLNLLSGDDSAIRRSVKTSTPFGAPEWADSIERGRSDGPRGRPVKSSAYEIRKKDSRSLF